MSHTYAWLLCSLQVAVNNNITTVWMFWDSHKMFNEWTGVLRQLYFSAAALVAGWVSVVTTFFVHA